MRDRFRGIVSAFSTLFYGTVFTRCDFSLTCPNPLCCGFWNRNCEVNMKVMRESCGGTPRVSSETGVAQVSGEEKGSYL